MLHLAASGIFMEGEKAIRVHYTRFVIFFSLFEKVKKKITYKNILKGHKKGVCVAITYEERSIGNG